MPVLTKFATHNEYLMNTHRDLTKILISKFTGWI